MRMPYVATNKQESTDHGKITLKTVEPFGGNADSCQVQTIRMII